MYDGNIYISVGDVHAVILLVGIHIYQPFSKKEKVLKSSVCIFLMHSFSLLLVMKMTIHYNKYGKKMTAITVSTYIPYFFGRKPLSHCIFQKAQFSNKNCIVKILCLGNTSHTTCMTCVHSFG